MVVQVLTTDILPIVGKQYIVPCIYYPPSSHNPFVPVLGTRHEDAELIGFPQEHFHYDFRFMSDYQLRVITLFSRLSSQGDLSLEQLLPLLMNCVNTRSESVALRSKLCYRAMPVFPSHHVGGPYPGPYHFMRALEEVYRDTHVTCGKCPHRGMDLRGVPADEEGRIVCPLHGLRWSREGTLAPRVLL